MLDQIREIKFTRGLQFGVEIEFNNNVVDALKEALERRGLQVKRVCGVEHSNYRAWKIERDSSCGFELVSPVLKGIEGLEELNKACEALNEVGAKVDSRCGLHVHHYAGDLKLEKIKNIYRLYSKYQEVINDMLPKSRRENHYAKNITKQYLEVVEGIDTLEKMMTVIGGKGEGHYTSKRYFAVNFASYVAYGTVEFRQHSGTTEFEKIMAWVILTHKIVERSNMRVNIKPWSSEETYQGIKQKGALLNRLCKEIELTGTCLVGFYRQRINKFKKASEQVA